MFHSMETALFFYVTDKLHLLLAMIFLALDEVNLGSEAVPKYFEIKFLVAVGRYSVQYPNIWSRDTENVCMEQRKMDAFTPGMTAPILLLYFNKFPQIYIDYWKSTVKPFLQQQFHLFSKVTQTETLFQVKGALYSESGSFQLDKRQIVRVQQMFWPGFPIHVSQTYLLSSSNWSLDQNT